MIKIIGIIVSIIGFFAMMIWLDSCISKQIQEENISRWNRKKNSR